MSKNAARKKKMNLFICFFFSTISSHSSILLCVVRSEKVNDRRYLNSFCLKITHKIGLRPSSVYVCVCCARRKVFLFFDKKKKKNEWTNRKQNRTKQNRHAFYSYCLSISPTYSSIIISTFYLIYHLHFAFATQIYTSLILSGKNFHVKGPNVIFW